MPRRIAGQSGHGAGRRQQYALLTDRRSVNTYALQGQQVVWPADLALVDTQAQGRAAVVGLQNRLPGLRMVFADTVNPPLRMVPDSLGFALARGQHGLAFAQKPAQTAVDETRLVSGFFALLGSFYRLVHQGVSGIKRLIDLRGQRQRHTQQGISLRRWLAADQLLAQSLGQTQPAQRMKAQGLNAGPQVGCKALQLGCHGAAGAHCHQQRSGALQLQPKRHLLCVRQPGGRGLAHRLRHPFGPAAAQWRA